MHRATEIGIDANGRMILFTATKSSVCAGMVTWVIDERLSESRYDGIVSLGEAAERLGHRVVKTKYRPFDNSHDSELTDVDNMQPVVIHGTVEFCKNINTKWLGWTPGLYFNDNVKHWAKFAAHIGHDLLNWDYNIMPYAEVVRRVELFKTNVFVKPESGMKEFTGQVIRALHLEDDLIKLSPWRKIDPDTLCVVAIPKEIKAEFRYIIADKRVITGSEYRWDNKLDVRIDTHHACDVLALKVVQADWQADKVYVCDIALLPNNTAKVIELNAFSSSGLYACDTYMIVDAVSEAALKEFDGAD